jgi:hypothetical protein
MIMDFFDLKKAGADATGDVHFGEGLSAAAVRRLACDAAVIPIVLGSNSEPLDVGREERFVTPAIRRALIARDRGCVICGAPPDQCDAHHLVHWIDGGETAVGNLVLLCKPNHREADRGEWIIQIVNGKVLVTRPAWAEPGHEPSQTGPGHAGPGQNGPGQTGPGHAGSGHAGSGHAGVRRSRAQPGR